MAFAISANRSNASITIADAQRFLEVGVPSFWHSVVLALGRPGASPIPCKINAVQA
jgi:hypothetical protein